MQPLGLLIEQIHKTHLVKRLLNLYLLQIVIDVKFAVLVLLGGDFILLQLQQQARIPAGFPCCWLDCMHGLLNCPTWIQEFLDLIDGIVWIWVVLWNLSNFRFILFFLSKLNKSPKEWLLTVYELFSTIYFTSVHDFVGMIGEAGHLEGLFDEWKLATRSHTTRMVDLYQVTQYIGISCWLGLCNGWTGSIALRNITLWSIPIG